MRAPICRCPSGAGCAGDSRAKPPDDHVSPRHESRRSIPVGWILQSVWQRARPMSLSCSLVSRSSASRPRRLSMSRPVQPNAINRRSRNDSRSGIFPHVRGLHLSHLPWDASMGVMASPASHRRACRQARWRDQRTSKTSYSTPPGQRSPLATATMPFSQACAGAEVSKQGVVRR